MTPQAKAKRDELALQRAEKVFGEMDNDTPEEERNAVEEIQLDVKAGFDAGYAERDKEIPPSHAALMKDYRILQEREQKLVSALRFYADETNFQIDYPEQAECTPFIYEKSEGASDMGLKARAVLKELGL